MISPSPEHFWQSFFQREVKNLSNLSLPEDEALKVIEQLKEQREQNIDVNIADMTASVIINDGKNLEEIWEEVIQPGLVRVAVNYGSAGIIVSYTRAYLDNPDVARVATRHAAPLFGSTTDSGQSVLEISQSALRKGLELLDLDPSGFSLIRMVHNPDYFSIMEELDPHFRITNALVRYGTTRYQNVYKQLAKLEKRHPK